MVSFKRACSSKSFLISRLSSTGWLTKWILIKNMYTLFFIRNLPQGLVLKVPNL